MMFLVLVMLPLSAMTRKDTFKEKNKVKREHIHTEQTITSFYSDSEGIPMAIEKHGPFLDGEKNPIPKEYFYKVLRSASCNKSAKEYNSTITYHSKYQELARKIFIELVNRSSENNKMAQVTTINNDNVFECHSVRFFTPDDNQPECSVIYNKKSGEYELILRRKLLLRQIKKNL